MNPRRRLDDFIVRLTGIEQHEVDSAPDFDAVRRQFADFVGQSPIIGHNLQFDLGFLANNGLALRNPRCDTWDLAYVLYPGLPEYSLERLADRFGVRNPERPPSPFRRARDPKRVQRAASPRDGA